MGNDTLFARFGREFAQGHVLFREGDVGSVMYVIRAGRVRISREFETGEHTLAVLGAGDFFGEMALLNNKPRTATAVCLDALSAIEIDAPTLETMLLNDPEIAVRLVTRLARRLDSANAFIDVLLHRDPRVRVVLALARIADEFGARGSDGLEVPVSHGEIADTVCVPEAEVTRILERLARVRLVSPLPNGSYLVPEVPRMHEFAAHLGSAARSSRALAWAAQGAEAPRGGR